MMCHFVSMVSMEVFVVSICCSAASEESTLQVDTTNLFVGQTLYQNLASLV